MAPRPVAVNVSWGADTNLVLSDPTNEGLLTRDVQGIPNVWFDEKTPGNSFIDENGEIIKRPKSGLLRGGFGPSAYSLPGMLVKDEVYPIGLIETRLIIQLRNTILRDSGINLEVPVTTDTETEREALSRLIRAANATPGSAYKFYFPAASYAYAYEPTIKAGEALSPKFRRHNWFLPTAGDAQNFRYLRLKTDYLSVPNSVNIFSLGTMHTTGEYSNPTYCYKMESTGAVILAASDAFNKAKGNASVYPMVQF